MKVGASRGVLGCVVAVAAFVLACLPGSAWAAGKVIAPTAKVQARVATGPGVSAVPKVVPLRVKNPAAYARAKRAAARGLAQPRGATPRSGPLTAVPGALNSPGLSAAQQISAFGLNGDVTPPDTTGAIGPSQYLEIVNSEVAVYDRADLSLVGPPVDLGAFTSGVSPCDPQIKYDKSTNRWFYVALRCDLAPDQNELYVGYSKSGDPSDLASGWCKFTVPSTPTTSLDDYPKLGLDGSHIIIGANNFDAINELAPEQTAHILVAPKPGSGPISTCPSSPPTFTVFGSKASPLMTSAGNQASTPEPATIADTTSTTGYVVSADFDDSTQDFSGNKIMVWHISTATPPTLVADGDVSVSTFGVPPDAPQPGTSDHLDTMDGRLTQAVAAADPSITGSPEMIWTQHTADPTGSFTEAVVDWYEIDPTTLTAPHQQGTIHDTSGFAFNAAIAPTLNGGAAIDYNTGGPTQMVQIKAQARNASDTSGSMTPLGSPLASSTAIDRDRSCPSRGSGGPSCRWGDYAGASTDPSHADDVWGSNQVNGPQPSSPRAQWATQNFDLTPTGATGPTASFTANPSLVSPGTPVNFDGGGSTGTGLTYTWNFGDGTAPTTTGPTTSHPYTTSGVYSATLTVSDGTNIASTTHTVTVDTPPTAVFGALPNPTAANSVVGFSSAGSNDPDGTIIGYSWNFGDGSAPATVPNPTHIFGAPGTYTVTLTVTDNNGQTGTVSHTLTVVPTPVASFGISPNPALARSTVSLNASSSSAPGGVITSYNWSFGDGSTATTAGPTVSHSYSTAGFYTVGLTITDNHGQFATATHVETIKLPVIQGGLKIPKKQKLRTVLKKGLRITLAPSERVTATFLITTKLKKNGKSTTLTLLRSRPRGFGPGTHQVMLKFNAKAAKKIAGAKSVVITLKMTLTDQFGQRRTPTVHITLKR